jgi:hypothetical protein
MQIIRQVRIGLIAAFIGAIAVAGAIGFATGASAQAPKPAPPLRLTGEDLAFQVGTLYPSPQGQRGRQRGIVGRLYVRIDGTWLPAQVEADPPDFQQYPLGK